jgi:hypothetical protein
MAGFDSLLPATPGVRMAGFGSHAPSEPGVEMAGFAFPAKPKYRADRFAADPKKTEATCRRQRQAPSMPIGFKGL